MDKLKSFEELKNVVKDLKSKNKAIVWTNGCFDILHTGHIRYLQKAKEQGDILIIGLNSDSSVKNLKGNNRPIIPENERAEILSALQCVDYIIIFSEQHPTKYLEAIKPDVYVKGGDYNINTIVQEERKIIESYQGKIAIINVSTENSTTNIINKIKESI